MKEYLKNKIKKHEKELKEDNENVSDNDFRYGWYLIGLIEAYENCLEHIEFNETDDKYNKKYRG